MCGVMITFGIAQTVSRERVIEVGVQSRAGNPAFCNARSRAASCTIGPRAGFSRKACTGSACNSRSPIRPVVAGVRGRQGSENPGRKELRFLSRTEASVRKHAFRVAGAGDHIHATSWPDIVAREHMYPEPERFRESRCFTSDAAVPPQAKR